MYFFLLYIKLLFVVIILCAFFFGISLLFRFFPAKFWLSAVGVSFIFLILLAGWTITQSVCVCARVCIDVWVCASVNVSICHFCSQLFSSSAICGSKSPSSTRNAFVPCARFIVTDRPRPLLYIPFNPTYGTSTYVPYTRVYIYKVGGRMIEWRICLFVCRRLLNEIYDRTATARNEAPFGPIHLYAVGVSHIYVSVHTHIYIYRVFHIYIYGRCRCCPETWTNVDLLSSFLPLWSFPCPPLTHFSEGKGWKWNWNWNEGSVECIQLATNRYAHIHSHPITFCTARGQTQCCTFGSVFMNSYFLINFEISKLKELALNCNWNCNNITDNITIYCI